MIGTVAEEHRSHIQAATSSNKMICSVNASIGNNTYEVLLDSGSSISSISEKLVQLMNLPTSSAIPIQVLFGDNNQVYTSNSQAHLTFQIAHLRVSHNFYILPRQLFPITLGCDWFVQSGAQIHFDSRKLVLPSIHPIQIFSNTNTSPIINNTQTLLEEAPRRLKDIQSLLQRFPQLFKKSNITHQVKFPVKHTIIQEIPRRLGWLLEGVPQWSNNASIK